MKDARHVSHHDRLAVLPEIERQTGGLHVLEAVRDFARLRVKTLDREVVVFVSAPRDDVIVHLAVGMVSLHVCELDHVHGGVHKVRITIATVPSDLVHRILQVSHVPHLDTLTHCTASSYHVSPIIAHLNRISTDLCQSECRSQLVSPDVPEFD